MDASIRQLREALEPYLSSVALHQFRRGVGLEVQAPPRLVTSERPELFHACREWTESASAPDEKARRLRLTAFLAAQVEGAIARDAQEAIANHTTRAQVVLDHDVLEFHQALFRMTREPARVRRLELERGLGQALWEGRGLYRRRIDAHQRTAERLGFRSHGELFDSVSGIDRRALQTDAERTLARTEDAYRDVLGYVVHKLDAKLASLPGGAARRPDVQLAMRTFFADVFRREDFLPAVHRWLADFGLTPHAEGRIRHDAEERDGRSPRPFVAAIAVPDDIRLALVPESGVTGATSLMHELGHAQSLAHMSTKLPVEDRRLGDPSLGEGWATVFEHLLTDALWLKRYLRLPVPLARDVARVCAFASLFVLRRSAAALQMETRLEEGGPDEALAEAYADFQRAALFVDVDRRFVFFERDPERYALRYLRGWALEARLRPVLEQRFDEDFWRNPGASSLLQSLWAEGGREDAAAVSINVCAQPLSVEVAGERLTRILGA